MLCQLHFLWTSKRHLSVDRDKVCGQEDRQGRWKVLSILPSLVSVAAAIFSYPLPTLPTKDIR